MNGELFCMSKKFTVHSLQYIDGLLISLPPMLYHSQVLV